jgi:phage gp29-like protein
MADRRYRKWRRGQDLPARPEIGFFDGWGRRDQFASAVGAITPAKLGQALRAADGGDLSAQAELWEKLEQDPHIFSVLSKRKRACVEKPLDLSPPDESDLAKRVLDFCRAELEALDTWDEVLFDLFDATGKGYSVGQNVWTIEGSKVHLGAIDWWSPREFCFDWHKPNVLRVLTDAEPTSGEELAPGQWIVHRHKASSDDLSHSSLNRKICWEYVFKHFPKRDWVIFCEAYGMPRRRGKYPRGTGAEDLAILEKALMDLGADGAAMIPNDLELEFMELKLAGQLPFPKLIEHCNAEISKAVLGQTLTTEAGDRGARSLGEVHERVEASLVRADCRAMARTIRRHLLRPLTHFNFGPAAPVPLCEFRFEEPVDLTGQSQIDERLARMGLPLSKEELYEFYKRHAPKDEADTLSSGSSAPAPPVAEATA